jgi:hypothetical protein
MKWRHSGFSVDNGVQIKKEDKEGTEAIVQYMLRNVFSTESIQYVEKTGKVIYRTGKMLGKQHHDQNRKNFSVYDATEFIAAITQHIPKKSFQTIRYYGEYSNMRSEARSSEQRGIRAKAEIVSEEIPPETRSGDVEVFDLSRYRPKKVSSLTWRECIKKIWKADPLICPECLSEMKLISFITETSLIKKILEYLGLWKKGKKLQAGRAPPYSFSIPDEVVYVPIEDAAWDWQERPDLVG